MNKRDRLREIQKRRSNKSYCYHAENLGEAEEDFFVEYIEELLNPWKDAGKELPPKENGSCSSMGVLAKDALGFPVVAHYDYDLEYWQDSREFMKEEVTEWMYIPEIQGE